MQEVLLKPGAPVETEASVLAGAPVLAEALAKCCRFCILIQSAGDNQLDIIDHFIGENSMS